MRVAVYARVSGDRQKEEQTIQSQLAEIREFSQGNQSVKVSY